MAVINKLDFRALPIQTANTFLANFNAGPGTYDFGLVGANTGALVIPINPAYVYLIDRCSFSCTLDEGDYLDGLTTTPTARLRYRNSTLAYLPAACIRSMLRRRLLTWPSGSPKSSRASSTKKSRS